jgi:RHS repeat-associated protein
LTNGANGGKVMVVGTTSSPATNVAVNVTNAALLYGDATFAATNMPFTTNYTAVASDSLGRRATNTVSVSIAANNALFQYDGNGNLIYDGLRSFTYDDENQLIQVCVTNQWLSQFVYDGKMRRRIRQECAWQGGVWVQTNEVYYVYDGNVVVQERDVNNLPTTTYTRGLDLSGSLQGAGGIGGLLARTSQAYADAPLAGQSYYHCDGNGNVTMLINNSQAIVAKYLYDAFGNILSKSGLLADANLYRFSSKEAHPNSGLVYYLYRYYDPNLQRWLNRDPIGETGGNNLYEFVRNDPVIFFDSLGYDCSDPCGDAKKQHLDIENGKPSGGGVICCGGKQYACVWNPNDGTTAGNIISKCILAHENQHIKDGDVKCDNNSQCPTRPKFAKGKDPDTAECDAALAELRCLASSTSGCGGDQSCINQVNKRREQMLDFAAAHCGAMKGHFPHGGK